MTLTVEETDRKGEKKHRRRKIERVLVSTRHWNRKAEKGREEQ